MTTRTAAGTKAPSTGNATAAPQRAARAAGAASRKSGEPAKKPAKPRAPRNPETGDVAKALWAELRKKYPPEIAGSALATSALALAREIDIPDNSATSKSMCARALLEALDRLRELAPAEREEDQLDDLTSRRANRVTRGAAS